MGLSAIRKRCDETHKSARSLPDSMCVSRARCTVKCQNNAPYCQLVGVEGMKGSGVWCVLEMVSLCKPMNLNMTKVQQGWTILTLNSNWISWLLMSVKRNRQGKGNTLTANGKNCSGKGQINTLKTDIEKTVCGH